MTAKEAFEAQEILKEFRKGLDSLSESKLIGALDLAIEALKVQNMTLYMNLPEVSVEEAVEILKRNNRIELLPSAQLEHEKGEWIINSDGYYPYCSECRKEPKSGDMTDFCPNCGCDMRGKNNGKTN